MRNLKTDDHLYTISRSEFAKQIGKSREAVKQDMRRGKYRDLYIFKNGKYFFKSREEVRPNMDLYPVKTYPVKRKRNRGGHDAAVKKGKYPNAKFAERNAMQRYLAAKGGLTAQELNRVPEIERKLREERRDNDMNTMRQRKAIPARSEFTSYSSGLFNQSNKGYPYTTLAQYTNRDYTVNNDKYRPTNRGTKKQWKNPYW